jgi:cytochrome P450
MALPPGPPWPAFVQTMHWWRRPLELLDECARRYGDVFTLRMTGLGDFVVVSTPEHIKQVFTGDPEVMHAAQANEILRPAVGSKSLFLLDGAAHQRARRLLTPPLMGERMAVYAETMHRSTLAAMRSFPVGRPFSIHPSMKAITLEVILHTVFGLDERDGLDVGVPGFTAMLTKVFRAPPGFLLLLPTLRLDLPLSPYRAFLRSKVEVDRAIYRLIERRRSRGDLAERKDILSLLLCARDEAGEPMTDEEVHDELITMVAAGHETTATALAWTFERLVAEPSVLEKAQREAQAAVSEGPAALAKLEYIDAVIKETLRFRPVVPLVSRFVRTPYEIAGYTLPAGSAPSPCSYLAQRRPESYPEPERFLPERWIGKKVDPYAWLPFGGGFRRCIGMGFALYEMKIVVATVLSRARLRPGSPVPERPVRRLITMFPSEAGNVMLTELATIPPA